MYAARLMYDRDESEYFTAKRKAARRLRANYKHSPQDLPSNREIRDEILCLTALFGGAEGEKTLRDMRLTALRFMRKLRRFHPHLIGSVLVGHIRNGSDIDLHLFSDSLAGVMAVFDEERLRYEVEKKRIIKHNQERIFTHIHAQERYTIEVTLYPADKLNYVFLSSITGGPIERASIDDLEELLLKDSPDVDLEEELSAFEDAADPHELFRMLLLPLEEVKQHARHHPEGDALYHSLQVFDLAREERPWDSEFLLAALLHDVGKGIDSADHTRAGVEALEGLVTDRTLALIAGHMEALSYVDGKMGKRARRRIEASEHFEDLLLLRDCDNRGRVPGVEVSTVDEALEVIRALDEDELFD